jgi:hypothetical protein
MLEWGGRWVGYWAWRWLGEDEVDTEERAGRQYGGGGGGEGELGWARGGVGADVAEEGTLNGAVAAEQEQAARTCGGGDELDIEERERGRRGGKAGDEGEQPSPPGGGRRGWG